MIKLFVIFLVCAVLGSGIWSYYQNIITEYKLITHSISNNIHNENSTTVYVPVFSAKPGDKIKVPVNIKKNPGILGMALTVNYDDNALVLDKAEEGNVFKNILNFTQSNSLKNGARFVWHGIRVNDKDIRDGTILYLYFTISEDVNSGKYPIHLSLGDDDVVDNYLKNISIAIKQGSINID